MNTNNVKYKKFRPADRRKKRRSGPANASKKEATLDPSSLMQKNEGSVKEKFVAAKRFAELPLSHKLKVNIHSKGYEWPTEIQQDSLDLLLEGRDLIGIASTGTGKTAAFLIPLVEQLLTGPSEFTTLIVVPTRELALQVEQELRDLTRGMNFYSSCFIGGTNVERDVEKLRRRNHFIIGTPGRLLDMADRGALKLGGISVLILDEFDRMLDMGFIQDIRKMVRAIGNRKQTMLFSATIDPAQKELIREIVKDPHVIKVHNGTDASSSVKQHIVNVEEGANKFEMLVDLISDESFSRVIVFAETKRMVDKLSKRLNRSGVEASHIHGDKTQNFRNRAIKRFKDGTSRVLVATDVAARGIDIDDVSHVINYQLPKTRDSYVHRIGRTGRAGKEGIAYTFVDKGENSLTIK